MYPLEWDVFVSMDDIKWTHVDSQNLSENISYGTYETHHDYARYIKFQQKRGHHDTDKYKGCLVMTHIDFFGIIGPTMQEKTVCICRHFYLSNFILYIMVFIII